MQTDDDQAEDLQSAFRKEQLDYDLQTEARIRVLELALFTLCEKLADEGHAFHRYPNLDQWLAAKVVDGFR